MKTIVRGGFGLEPPQVVTIRRTGVHKGRQVFDYTDSNGLSRWCYAEQVEKIL